jgi:limonene-1,2-epoxide hydrolase
MSHQGRDQTHRRGFIQRLGVGVGVLGLGTSGVLVGTSAHASGSGGSCGSGGQAERLVLDLLDSLQTLNPTLWLPFLSPNLLYQNTGMPDIVGRDNFFTFISGMVGFLSEFRAEIINVVSEGRLVATERIEHYTVAANSPVGIPGASLDLPVAGWFEVKHGKVARWSDYWDTATFTRALGIPLPTP